MPSCLLLRVRTIHSWRAVCSSKGILRNPGEEPLGTSSIFPETRPREARLLLVSWSLWPLKSQVL